MVTSRAIAQNRPTSIRSSSCQRPSRSRPSNYVQSPIETRGSGSCAVSHIGGPSTWTYAIGTESAGMAGDDKEHVRPLKEELGCRNSALAEGPVRRGDACVVAAVPIGPVSDRDGQGATAPRRALAPRPELCAVSSTTTHHEDRASHLEAQRAALSLVGPKWRVEIVNVLAEGPRVFDSLRTDVAGISAKVLADVLRTMEEAGLVRRRQRGRGHVWYVLTPAGGALHEALRWLGWWAQTHVAPTSTDIHVR